MDMSELMERKLGFDTKTYHSITNLIGRIDTFRGNWHFIEQSKTGYGRAVRYHIKEQ